MERLHEHRKHVRQLVHFPCIFSIDGTHIIDGVVVDLSMGGCRIKCGHAMHTGLSIELQVRPEHHAPVYVPYADIRWVEQDKLGVAFSQVSESDAATLVRLLTLLPTS